MSTARTADLVLDLNGQNERVNRLYTHLTFCFSHSDDSSYDASTIEQLLRTALNTLRSALPWIGGRVVKREQDGLYAIRIPNRADGLPQDRLTVNEELDLNFDDLRACGFPASLLHEDRLAPCSTFLADIPEDGAPVFLIKAVLVKGGLLLTLAAQHGSMDMTGGNRIQTSADQLQPTIAPQTSRDHAGPSAAPDPAPAWTTFRLPATALTTIKASATKDITSGFISTDDTITALVWQAITRATTHHHNPAEQDTTLMQTTLSRNVDLRPALHLLAPESIMNQPLGRTAQSLRTALDSEKLVEQFDAQAEEFCGARDNQPIPKQPPATDRNSTGRTLQVRVSSWATYTKVHEFEFGLGLGPPVAVRRPAFRDGAREGLVYFLPKTTSRAIDVMVCLRPAALNELRELVEDHGAIWIG
ncbi:Trichothecene 3-O-acetyltransferase [Cyphellophora attinorum]|uniref:Trichothecene 3-O-acetyltransferase n=1 Tax=Cyphellophora attinorum TaxID=1664694 RepID=A0A0N1NWD2_9EURO|nr:Trichothecene 3-O-acetyltransferase [Phialophora attinorum]KPI36325.1 Trichothecene 3-O-acetyltransferase [Phialophora attinorum]